MFSNTGILLSLISILIIEPGTIELRGLKLDSAQIRLRIRHFLLQQSTLFQRAAAKGFSSPLQVSAIARELSEQIDMPERRIQKYLTEELGPKEISITLSDIELFAHMKNLPISQFIAYLLEENFSSEITGWKKSALDFIQTLHDGHRRLLNATLFSGKDHRKSERLIELLIQLYSLDDPDISTIESITSAFKLKKNQGQR